MEHRRRCYEVLVNPKEEEKLVWKKDFCGHVPDIAVPFPQEKNGKKDNSNRTNRDEKDGGIENIISKKDDSNEEHVFYIGRIKVSTNYNIFFLMKMMFPFIRKLI